MPDPAGDRVGRFGPGGPADEAAAVLLDEPFHRMAVAGPAGESQLTRRMGSRSPSRQGEGTSSRSASCQRRTWATSSASTTAAASVAPTPSRLVTSAATRAGSTGAPHSSRQRSDTRLSTRSSSSRETPE